MKRLDEIFTAGDVAKIKQQGGKSYAKFEANIHKINAGIHNGIPTTAFISLAQNSAEDTRAIDKLFSHKPEELTVDLMSEAIFEAQSNNPEKDKHEEHKHEEHRGPRPT